MKSNHGHHGVFVLDPAVVKNPPLLSAAVSALYPRFAPERRAGESTCDYLTRAHGSKGLAFTLDQAHIRISSAMAKRSRPMSERGW